MNLKQPPYRSKKLRESARGRECQVRILGVCNGDSQTTVFAHSPHDDSKGMALKPDDLGAWACSACHDEIDGRTHHTGLDRTGRLFAFYGGVFRTVREMLREGILTDATRL